MTNCGDLLQMVKKNKIQVVSRRRRQKKQIQRQVIGSMNRFGLPSRYPPPLGDVIPVTLKASSTLAADGSGYCTGLVVYGKGVTGAGYIFLDDLIPGFGALCTVYSRFIIKQARVEVRTVTATLNGGFVAVNYEPTDSNRANPPASLSDVSNAVHYSTGTAGAPGSITFKPSDYFNDWKQCVNDSATNDPYSTQMGVSQIYGGGFTALTASALLYEVEIEAYFCGYRA